MEAFDRKKHWETIYQTKQLNEVSWYQPTPEISLELIHAEKPAKRATIIDVGGGDSFLIDHLLAEGFTNLHLLDISENAIARAKNRLDDKATHVNYHISDIISFEPQEHFDIWHDRAAFHFLTAPAEIQTYVSLAANSIRKGGALIVGTFSKNGPTKCSGIEIKQYSIEDLTETFSSAFELIFTKTLLHNTPFDTTQEFVFCTFHRK